MARATDLAVPELDALLHATDKQYLRPRSSAIAAAKAKARRLIDELHFGSATMFQVRAVHDHGSLSRGTGLRYFNDLDCMIELDADALRTRAGKFRSARDTISRMASFVRTRRAGLVSMGSLQVRAQDHSVGIRYPQSQVRIDLVPGVPSGRGFSIPESGTGRWIHTNPQGSRARLEEAKGWEPSTGVAIRLLKGWARARGNNAPFPSFAIETMVVDMVLEHPRPLSLLVHDFFVQVGSVHAGRRLTLGPGEPDDTPVSLRDPVSGNNLTNKMTGKHRIKLVKACRSGEKRLHTISGMLRRNRWDQAATAAQKLFVGRSWQ